MKKTRAIQILEDSRVAYEVRTYDSEGFASAVEVAAKLGIAPEAVFKTLVARGERTGVVMALVPADRNLDLRKLAHILGDKRAEMVDPDELPRLTGYIRGGVSPLGGKRAYPTFVDGSALRQDRISVSAGVRGAQILVAPGDLMRLTGGSSADIVEQ
ncbi:MAG TPA: Cys-tRNA(Pro) deacylase [Chloroflexota bacterium]